MYEQTAGEIWAIKEITMSKQELILIDQYLTGSLSSSERAVFENRLLNDETFKESYEFVVTVKKVTEIKNDQVYLKALLKDVALDVPVKSIWPKLLNWSSVAAVLIAVFLFWQPHKMSNEELFQTFSNPTINYSKVYLDTLSNFERSGALKDISGLTQQESEQVFYVHNYMVSGNFDQALLILEKLSEKVKGNSMVLYYIAICQLHLNKVAEAKEILLQLASLKSFSLQPDATYYLALCYIKEGERTKARKLLKSLLSEGTENSYRAKQILERMRWF